MKGSAKGVVGQRGSGAEDRAFPRWHVQSANVECVVATFLPACPYMSPQQGSLLLGGSSSGAMSFSSGGSPLAGVK